MKQIIKSILINLFIVLLGAGIALASSYNGVIVFNNLPLFALGVIFVFAINWIAFIPAYIFKTEKFFDLTGSISYISVTLICAILSPGLDARSAIVLVLVIIWAVRLGTFLFKRILVDGKDGRFDKLKTSFLSFLTVWTLQGLWVVLTLAPALVILTGSEKRPLELISFTGIGIWIIGFCIEVIADAQKTKWRANPVNKGKFINAGLWRRSRHPNYFGEILIWLGMAIISLPVLQGWQYISLVSPIFVFLLLTRISGIPMLEKRADKIWGGMEDYEKYKKQTPVLIPKLWLRVKSEEQS